MTKVEIQQIGRQFEHLRLKDKRIEGNLLSQILQEGIHEPLGCVFKNDQWILVDGFKRLRCCIKLKIHKLKVINIGQNNADALLNVLKKFTIHPLHIIEQAGIVEYLNQETLMSVSEIARHLNRSPAWVSVRVGLITGMSPVLRKAVFSGKIPVRSVMYSLKAFTRVKSKEVDVFVGCVAGKGLSVREIDELGKAYFQKDSMMKEQIQKGELRWTLNQIKAMRQESEERVESPEMKQLQWLLQSMQTVTYRVRQSAVKNSKSWQKSNVVIKTILNLMPLCQKTLEEIND